MAALKTIAFIILFVAVLAQSATKMAALNEARHLKRGSRADDPRLDVPAITIHPEPNLNLLWGSLEGIPSSLRRTVRFYRTATAVVALAGLAVFGLLAFG
jgi:hypothetical protein